MISRISVGKSSKDMADTCECLKTMVKGKEEILGYYADLNLGAVCIHNIWNGEGWEFGD